MLDLVDDCVVLVNPDTHGVLFVNNAAKELEIKADGVASFSFEEGSTYPSLAREAFVRLDKGFLMKNIVDP